MEFWVLTIAGIIAVFGGTWLWGWLMRKPTREDEEARQRWEELRRENQVTFNEIQQRITERQEKMASIIANRPTTEE